jgi:hypothetical protein
MVNRVSTSNISLCLKLIGTICILSFAIDFIFLLFPFQPTDKLWQINLAKNLVDRGILPMLGLGLMLGSYWFDSASDPNRSSSSNLKLPIFIISTLLGLIFFVIFPIHLNNVNQVKIQALQGYNRESEQLELQVKNQLQQIQTQLTNQQVKANLDKQRLALKEQLSAQLNELIQDDQKYNQALNSSQLPEIQKNLLKQYKANPKALDNFIAQQTNPQQLAEQRIVQIRTDKEQRLKKTQEDASKELRTGIMSLLLSIGYTVIGWTGLRSLGIGNK